MGQNVFAFSPNPFVPNAHFFCPLKTSENLKVFWCFQAVEKGRIGNEWVKEVTESTSPSFISRSNRHRRCSIKKSILNIFAKFVGKHLYRRAFFSKVVGLKTAILSKTRLRHRCFPLVSAKFLRRSFLQNISGRLLLWKEGKKWKQIKIFAMKALSLRHYEDAFLSVRNIFYQNICFFKYVDSVSVSI